MADAAISVPAEATAGELAIDTSRFGRILVDADKVITMTSPFLGFPESRRFILRPHGQDSPFMWLQSLDNPGLAFVMLHAATFFPQYQPKIPAFVLKELGNPAEGEQEMFLILTIPKGNPQQMTANLLGPVVMNVARRLAKQVLLDPTQYTPCWPLFSQA
ncbi:MAG: flagellar assembly protein FliW [Thermodesulfobacteriota bacterium]